MKLPMWARKPNHSKTVIATPRGWMVKETREYLKLVKNLDERLKSLQSELDVSLKSIEEIAPEEESTEAYNESLEEVVPKKIPTKKRGRKPKNNEEESTETCDGD